MTIILLAPFLDMKYFFEVWVMSLYSKYFIAEINSFASLTERARLLSINSWASVNLRKFGPNNTGLLYTAGSNILWIPLLNPPPT